MPDTVPVARTYGGWRTPRSSGVGSLSMGETISLLAAMVAVVVVQQAAGTPWAVLAAAVVGAVLLAVTSTDRHGVSEVGRLGERWRWRRARRRGQTRYVGGPLAPRYTTGRFRVPGILWGTTLSEHCDAWGRRFALVHHSDGCVAVVMGLWPAGTALVDTDQVDDLVARWGVWLGDLGGEAGVVGASVVVETSPDSGQRLRRAVGRRLAGGAPAAAVAVVEDVVGSSAAGGAQVQVWATLTLSPQALGVGRRHQVEREVASRLPALTQTLQAAGTGPVHLLTAPEVCQVVRTAYDPAAAVLFDEAASRGEVVGLEWGDVGPAGHEAGWETYRHDSGTSRTWTVSRPPAGTVHYDVLDRILDVHRDVERKRVTILYHPIEAARAPELVDRDVSQAAARAGSRRQPTARDVRAVAVTRQMAEEEAAGAGLVDFGMLVTCTVTSGDVEEAAVPVESLAASSRLLVRPAYGCQDSAFAVGLPLGIRPPLVAFGRDR